jgi:hypothetical protein
MTVPVDTSDEEAVGLCEISYAPALGQAEWIKNEGVASKPTHGQGNRGLSILMASASGSQFNLFTPAETVAAKLNKF